METLLYTRVASLILRFV